MQAVRGFDCCSLLGLILLESLGYQGKAVANLYENQGGGCDVGPITAGQQKGVAGRSWLKFREHSDLSGLPCTKYRMPARKVRSAGKLNRVTDRGGRVAETLSENAWPRNAYVIIRASGGPFPPEFGHMDRFNCFDPRL